MIFKFMTFKDLGHIPVCDDCEWAYHIGQRPCAQCSATKIGTNYKEDIYYFKKKASEENNEQN